MPAGRRRRSRAGDPATSRPSLRRRAVAVIAVLGALGLTAAIVAPTGTAFGVQPGDHRTLSTEAKIAQDAQSLTIGGSADGRVTLEERGSFGVTNKHPQTGLTPFTGGGTRSQWLTEAGIAEEDWVYVDYIVQRESSWNPNATNRSSGACGLVQALPCSKVPGNGYHPVDNLRWADGYAQKRYGGWEQAYVFWTKNHWW